jgi:hypothetical protein
MNQTRIRSRSALANIVVQRTETHPLPRPVVTTLDSLPFAGTRDRSHATTSCCANRLPLLRASDQRSFYFLKWLLPSPSDHLFSWRAEEMATPLIRDQVLSWSATTPNSNVSEGPPHWQHPIHTPQRNPTATFLTPTYKSVIPISPSSNNFPSNALPDSPLSAAAASPKKPIFSLVALDFFPC